MPKTPREGALRLGALALFLAAAFAPGAFGALFAPDEWYRALLKPAWTPPGWLFAPVWSILYLTIGLSGYLVWRVGGLRAAPGAFALYALQLVLNGLWPFLFFGLHAPGAALFDLIALLLAAALTTLLFWRVRLTAAALLIPYLLWLGYALALNHAIWRMNPV